jgi:NAD(P)-dependent dehydrogenase (short-subunit alcohol dehydrogenase family)
VAQGGEAVAHHGSVASAGGATGATAKAVDSFGGLDILVNNAGILRDKTLLKMSEEMWDQVIAVHLKGTFLCTQAAAQKMKERGQGGRIINTTSVSGMLGNFGQANYAAAKAGIYGLTRTASIELQRYNIMVNAVAPLAKTRMTEDLPLFEKLEGSMTPEHVAPAHVFFASELSAGMTGVVLSVAGGKLSCYRMVETRGSFKEGEHGVWTPQEIQENFEAISKA